MYSQSRVTSHESRNLGFTLLEVMVSVALMGVIMTLIWTSSSQSFRSKERIEARDDVFHAAQVAMRKISDDVAAAFLTKRTTISAAAGGGETATRSPYKTFFIGEDRGEQDSMRFTSLSHVRLMKNSKQSDQTKIAYEVLPDEEVAGRYNVVRREQPWLDDTDEVQGTAFRLLEGVLSFNVEYYDIRKKEWGKEWNTDKLDWSEKLPLAVRISVVFPDPDGGDRNIPLSTACMPALSEGTIDL
ncbi:MAG: prepilin-type N-terminal cleavage/methylation domain-containing protein [Proteobacteria bacterium]|nr:prepilin-type N-terminal cleavage/methylation domain-containing protein [Pseudomonadota bacterium]